MIPSLSSLGKPPSNKPGACRILQILMNTSDTIEVEGKVLSVLPNTMFRVEIVGTSHVVLAHISGKMRKRFIRLNIGDRVKLEMSPIDKDHARIVYRLDSRPPLPPGQRPQGGQQRRKKRN